MASLPSLSLGLNALVGDRTSAAASDEAYWLLRAQAGDGAALAQIYRRYVDEIYGYAVNQLGQQQEAEDITSEVFLRLVRALPGFRGEASLRTWLFSICRNVIRDHWRQRAGRPAELPLDDLARSGGSPALQAAGPRDADPDLAVDGDDDRAGSQDAHGARRPSCGPLGAWVLGQLSERDQAVLRLRFLENQSVAQAAETLGISPGNLKVIQHRALRRAAALAAAAEPASTSVSTQAPEWARGR